MLHPAVYIVVYWIPAIEQLNMPPLLMEPAALTNIPHYTLATQIIPNNTSMVTTYQPPTIDWIG